MYFMALQRNILIFTLTRFDYSIIIWMHEDITVFVRLLLDLQIKDYKIIQIVGYLEGYCRICFMSLFKLLNDYFELLEC